MSSGSKYHFPKPDPFELSQSVFTSKGERLTAEFAETVVPAVGTAVCAVAFRSICVATRVARRREVLVGTGRMKDLGMGNDVRRNQKSRVLVSAQLRPSRIMPVRIEPSGCVPVSDTLSPDWRMLVMLAWMDHETRFESLRR